MDIKALINRFHEWQKNPAHDSSNHSATNTEKHHCANCGNEFEGNFCPLCGQKSNVGRITWRSVWQNITNVVALDDKSLPYSIWQLIWRPGYMISDYINGRRQVSHPPASMLFIIAVFYSFLTNLLAPSKADISGTTEISSNDFVNSILNWIFNNPALSMLFMSMFFIIPTWLLFRHSHRHNHHSLPESIHIQIFESSAILIIVFFTNVFNSSILLLLIPIHYVICYKQLFGYSLWGTIWRTLICFIIWPLFFSIISLFLTWGYIGLKPGEILLSQAIVFITITLLLAISYWISKVTSKKKRG